MKFSLVTILPAFVFSSCFFSGERVTGDGHVITREKNIGNFTAVRSNGSMDVHIMQSGANSVKVQTDENLIPYLDIYVDGSTLVVQEKQGYNLNPSKKITVYVSSPVFRQIEMSGSGDIVSDNAISGNEPLKMDVSGSGNINMNVNLPKLDAEISGSGNIALKGQSEDLSISMSGSGNIKCFDLISDNVNIDMSGSSDAEVTANKKLDIEVSGSGSVRYKGNASVNQRISGSGEVKKEG